MAAYSGGDDRPGYDAEAGTHAPAAVVVETGVDEEAAGGGR
jgi:hypothetical protein